MSTAPASWPDERILILTPTGRDAPLAQGALTAAGLRADICRDVESLCREIGLGAGAVLIAKEALTPPVLRRVEEALAQQPPWSDLPLVVLTSGGGVTVEKRRRLQALDVLGGATLLERPLRVATLVSTVQAALRARRRQYEVRDHLEERARLEGELKAAYEKQAHIAETLQRSLLSKPPRAFAPGLEVETVYRAAKNEAEIGGDFYDVFALNGDKIALVVGDVSGKGLEAASHTAEVKYALRAFLRERPSPALSLDRMNDFLLDTQSLDGKPFNSFVAAAVCVLDLSSGTLTVANAGAEAPLRLSDAGDVETIAGNGPPLGVTALATYDEYVVALGGGDTVLLVTDGITEARRGREFFGYQGLVEAAQRAHVPGTLDTLGSHIVAQATDFAGGQLGDDVCVLLARLTENTPQP